MNGKTVFTPTEARQNFFEILKWVRAGHEIKIKSEGMIVRLNSESNDEKKTKKQIKAWGRLRKMNIKTMPIKQMKAIYQDTHKIELPE